MKLDPRLDLPYGKWTCADGREVLFNRRYQPMWERYDSVPVRLNGDEHIPFTKQEWFYTDKNIPRVDRETRRRVEEILKAFSETTVEIRKWPRKFGS